MRYWSALGLSLRLFRRKDLAEDSTFEVDALRSKISLTLHVGRLDMVT